MSDDVEDISRQRIDDRQPMDAIADQRVDGFEQRRVRTDALQLFVILLQNTCVQNHNHRIQVT